METATSPVTARTFLRRKGGALTMLTAYDFAFARIFDAAGIDALLIGDSLGNTVQGGANTLPVTMDEMVYHCRLVARAATRALVIGDLPFGAYQVCAEDALRNAIRLVKEGGCAAVKLEGGARRAEAIARIRGADIPVMAHVGLTPQSVHQSGYRVQGRGAEARAQVLADAQAVQKAGAFAVVLECIPHGLAREITARLSIPTIGIGAGPHCDGQVLVMHDLLGLGEFTPPFAKVYARLGALASQAARRFADDVARHKFPPEENAERESA